MKKILLLCIITIFGCEENKIFDGNKTCNKIHMEKPLNDIIEVINWNGYDKKECIPPRCIPEVSFNKILFKDKDKKYFVTKYAYCTIDRFEGFRLYNNKILNNESININKIIDITNPKPELECNCMSFCCKSMKNEENILSLLKPFFFTPYDHQLFHNLIDLRYVNAKLTSYGYKLWMKKHPETEILIY